MFAKIAARRRLDAVQPIAEVHLVEIELQDLVLGVHAFDARGKDELLKLAPHRFVGRQKALTGQLLRDRAAALRRSTRSQVGDGRRRDTDEIESAVPAKPLIFDRHDRIDEMRRHLPEPDFDALLLENREGQRVVAIVDDRRLIHLAYPADRRFVGKGPLQAGEKPEAAADGEHGDQREREGRNGHNAWMTAAGLPPVVLKSTETIA